MASNREDDALAALRKYMQSVPPGKVEDGGKALDLLTMAWDCLSGGRETGMWAGKLTRRAEELEWDPPLLSFRIERHGGTVHGSSRAEMQVWTVDLNEGRAGVAEAGFRQLKPNAPSYTKAAAEQDAARIASLICAGQDGDCVQFRKSGAVRVLPGCVLPDNAHAARTLEGRRKRLRQALTDALKPLGWVERSPWYFHREQ